MDVTDAASTNAPDPGLPGYRALLDACASAMVLVDGEAVIRLANRAYADLVGRDAEEIVGSPAGADLPHEIGAAAVDGALVSRRSGALVVPEHVVADAVGNRRRIAWTVQPVGLRPGRADGERHAPGGYWLATGVDVTRARMAEAAWRERAHTDPLTGLANRAAVLGVLDAHLDPAQGAGCAVLFCDLDGFKQVNDEHGHAAGDHVLTEVAARLSRSVREEDLVARLGGDEFVVVIPASGVITARAVAMRIEREIARPIRLDGVTFRIGVSIGTEVADPGQGSGPLLNAADRAMYAHKSARRAANRTRPAGAALADSAHPSSAHAGPAGVPALSAPAG